MLQVIKASSVQAIALYRRLRWEQGLAWHTHHRNSVQNLSFPEYLVNRFGGRVTVILCHTRALLPSFCPPELAVYCRGFSTLPVSP